MTIIHKNTDILASGLAKVNVAKFGLDDSDGADYAILVREGDNITVNIYSALRVIHEPGTHGSYTAFSDEDKAEFSKGVANFKPVGVWSFYNAGMMDSVEAGQGATKGGLAIGTLHVLVTEGHKDFDTVPTWVPKLPFDHAGYKNYLEVKSVEEAKLEVMAKLEQLEGLVRGAIKA